MNKLFTTLAALLCAISASANGNLYFATLDGKEIQAGETVVLSTVDADMKEFGILQVGGELNICGRAAVNGVTVTMTMTSGPDITFCMGSCFPTNNGVATSSPFNLAAGGKEEMQIHLADYTNPDAVLTGHATLTAKGGFGNDVTINLVVTNDPAVIAGIAAPAAAQGGVSVAGRTLNYAFADAKTRAITVSTLGGQTVASAQTAAQNGALSLDHLPAGVYIYNVAGLKPRKFILK